jgi:hypothetical protein
MSCGSARRRSLCATVRRTPPDVTAIDLQTNEPALAFEIVQLGSTCFTTAGRAAVPRDLQLPLREPGLRMALLQSSEQLLCLSAEVFETRTVRELFGHVRIRSELDPHAACRERARGVAVHAHLMKVS